jgi:hypothetical protein
MTSLVCHFLYKLHKLGVEGRIWNIINDCHVNTQSTVVVNQCQFKYYTVSEGVRREYSLQTSSIHCNVFGDVLIHDTSSASEGAQALDIYVNRLIDYIGDDKIPSSDNCCHLGIEMNSRLNATERTTNACRKSRECIKVR